MKVKIFLIVLFSISVQAQDSIRTFINSKTVICFYPHADSMTNKKMEVLDTVIVMDAAGDFYKIGDNKYVIKKSVYKNEELKLFDKGYDRAARLQLKEDERKAAEQRNIDYKKSLIKKFGKKNAERILQRKVWIGMTKDMALESWGEPEDVNRTITSRRTHEQWVYCCGSYLYFENGIVTTIQN